MVNGRRSLQTSHRAAQPFSDGEALAASGAGNARAPDKVVGREFAIKQKGQTVVKSCF